MENKLCPMKMQNPHWHPEYSFKECEKEKCAWWNKNDEQCSILLTSPHFRPPSLICLDQYRNKGDKNGKQ